jgi:hypothetical protein
MMKDRITLLVLSIAVVLTAAHAYHRFGPLRGDISETSGPLRAVVPTLVGEPSPQVSLVALGGAAPQDATEPAGAACRIMYFFDPACGACRASAPQWTGVAAIERGGAAVPVDWVLLGPDRDAAGAFVREFGIVAPVFVTGEDDPHQAFGVQGVPAIWGLRGDTLRHVSLGVDGTVPESIDVAWCAGASADGAR